MDERQRRLIELYGSETTRMSGILRAQEAARRALEQLGGFLRPGLTRREIVDFCEGALRSLGAEGWWLGGGALVLFGELSCYSGHDDPQELFDRANLRVGENDLVTADLAPMIEGGWGDCARSFCLQDGHVCQPSLLRDGELREGLELELKLHRAMTGLVAEGVTFARLHAHIDSLLDRAGYENLDYHGNFGHSIENHPSERLTIAEGVSETIVGHRKPLSFEPHIRKKGGRWGIKQEETYIWLDGRMEVI